MCQKVFFLITNRDLFLHYLAQTSDFPLMLEIESAKGVWLKGISGEKYLDLISGIGVSSIGHRHPKVIQAIKSQADKYLHLMVYGEFVQSPQVRLAEELTKTLPAELDNVYLLNSGSEAIEGALKLAKRYTGRFEVISFDNAYHGSSHGALSVGGSETFKRNFRPLVPGTKQLRFGKSDDLNQIDQRVAAVLIETVQGEAGVRTASFEYFKALREACDIAGALLIVDEIQCGFGRTGKFWAFEHYGFVPDIITSAKGMGGGMPIGAFISSRQVMAALKNDPILGHITTFGGHPVSAAASIATIEVLLGEELLHSVEEKAELFKKKLKHPIIKEIRNKGLMMAVEFESFDQLKPIIDRSIANGVLTDWFLFCDNSMRIAPPLNITHGEIEWACDRILESLDG